MTLGLLPQCLEWENWSCGGT